MRGQGTGCQLQNADSGKVLKEFKEVPCRGGNSQSCDGNPIPHRRGERFQEAGAPRGEQSYKSYRGKSHKKRSGIFLSFKRKKRQVFGEAGLSELF